MGTGEQKPFFRDINADEYDPEVTEMESLCFSCEKQGTTRLFLTKIPFFREVIVSSFSCDHCGNSNAELQSAGRIQDKGVRYSVNILNSKDLNRQVVQAPSATISIPELEFENPANKGGLTTVEGVIGRAIEGLSQDQVLRRIQHPEVAEKIDEFIKKLEQLKTCETPFHIIIDDPSGNSFIENPHAPSSDPQMKVTHYKRTREQNDTLCIGTEEEEEEKEQMDPKFNAHDEVLVFPSNCPGCNSPCQVNMKLLAIPHFKEVVIMASSCDACGLRDSEVKSGGGIEPMGRKIRLKLTDVSDLSRDVLKSETCCINIPELEFSTSMSGSAGKFSTLEGLLGDLITQLKTTNPFYTGDSGQEDKLSRMTDFCDILEKVKNGEMLDVHFELDDPTGNSYLQNLYAPDDDPNMTIELYERTFEQNEDLGINDMKTENYEQS
ncbi:zinc finger protein ZPR1-like [Dreissena polymorpha]|uniref:zinc finger protein ZPR1-like n=1 Tax=Dreissena polymorpha TaxID=45954 RepID=UPI0022651AF8|nr:zinc finger protein ZPR1-like [Dreissena polymorpha]